MRTVLFLVGVLVGIGGGLLLLAAVVSAAVTSFAWVKSLIVSQRALVKERQLREQALAHRRARVVADRRARVAAPGL